MSVGVAAPTEPIRFVGRQPIVDANLRLFGHELLFRAGLENAFSGDVDHAAQSVIDNALLMMPSENREIFFINCAKSTLLSRFVTLLPPGRSVLEILETVQADSDFLQCCQELRAQGYRFALDDYAPTEEDDPLLGLAEFVKIDFLLSDQATRRRIYGNARGKKLKFLAEKIETEADFKAAKAEGCTLFQGYFFCRPVMVPTRAVPQSKLIYMRLLAELSRNPVNIGALEQLVMSDTSICYRLLRLVNSALYSLPHPISSIRDALMRIGEDEFRKLVTLALVNAASTPQAKIATRVALERGKFCELLAAHVHEPASTLYLLGMLSLIDVILGMTMEQVMETIPLDPKLKAALLTHSGPLEAPLQLIRERELDHAEEADTVQNSLGVSAAAVAQIHAQAVQWADNVISLS